MTASANHSNFTAGPGLADYTKKLAGTARALLCAGGNLQSTGGGEQIDAVKLEAAIAARMTSDARSAPVVETRVAQVLQAANSALRKSAEGNAGDITPLERSGLEVIVQLVGRPALRYIDGHVQLPPTSLAENQLWEVFIATKRKEIDALSASVARLNLEQPGGGRLHLGTGWRIGENLLVTNRHVAAYLVADATRTHDEWQLDASLRCVADFAATDQPSAPQVFAIEALAYCASEEYVDAAVLKLKPSAAGFPPPLEADFDAAAIGNLPPGAGGFTGTEIYVVGHPYQPSATDEITSIFGDADGRKRCAPGMTTAARDEGPIFDHDCSTLRGNSGSPVVNRWTHRVVGLHFGGQTSDSAGNLGDANVAVAFSMLAKHRFADILKTGQV